MPAAPAASPSAAPPAPASARLYIAALRTVLKWPAGARRDAALVELLHHWRSPARDTLLSAQGPAWPADRPASSHTVAAIGAQAQRVQLERPGSALVLGVLNDWPEATAPSLWLNPGFSSALLDACGEPPRRAQVLDEALRSGLQLVKLNLRLTAARPVAGQGPRSKSSSDMEMVSAVGHGAPAPACSSVEVFFGTDRQPMTHADPGRRYGAMRGADAVSYGIAQVTLPATHQDGQIERPRWWRLEFSQDPAKHIVIHAVDTLAEADWLAQGALPGQDGFVFIHGFNTDFEESLWRTAQMAHDLKFTGRVLCFSWASAGEERLYLTDEETIDWSTRHIEAFLQTVARGLQLRRLHLVVHSMGNRALLAALERWQAAPGATPISQVVLAAPDVDADRFTQVTPALSRFEQVTLYVSRQDKAIAASRLVHQGARAGDGKPPLVAPGLVTVDVSEAGETMFGLGHSYFANVGKVFQDLFYIITQQLPPERRASVKPHPQGYWELR